MQRRGFSLIELVITIAIVATLAAIAIPRVTETRLRHESEQTARALTGAIDYAQSEARRRSTTIEVALAADATVIGMQAEADPVPIAITFPGAYTPPLGPNTTTPPAHATVIVDPHGRLAFKSAAATSIEFHRHTVTLNASAGDRALTITRK